MYQDISPIITRIKDIIREADTYLGYKNDFIFSHGKLIKALSEGKIPDSAYKIRMDKLLQGRTKEEMIEYYNSYIYSLLKKIEVLNSELFYFLYKDKSENKIKIDEELLVAVNKAKESAAARRKVEVLKRKIELENIRKEEERRQKQILKMEERRRVFEMRAAEKQRREEIAAKKAKQIAAQRAKKIRGSLKEKAVKRGPQKVEAGMIASTRKSKERIEKEREENLKKDVFAESGEQQEINLDVEQTFFQKQMSKLTYFLSKLLGMEKKESYVAKKTKISPSLMRLERLRERTGEELKAEAVSATLLTEEAKKIHAILERKRGMKERKMGLYVSFANRVIKGISYALLKKFPFFFKRFYTLLRLANINMLSNTYLNVGVLSVILSLGIGFFVFFIFFIALLQPLVQILVKSIALSIAAGVIAALTFYTIPLTKMKIRRRSINTNLPFAVNHMSAVVGSGVSPTRMFELIAQSNEYGEIAVELAKIVEFIKLFGYDMVTAVKTVSSTTPSDQMREFFEGFVSNVESGGDIKDYLLQKADESMVNYELERKKYVETISTYSDIYTGILIAAPLFFVAALSLVSMLGGEIGGVDVNIIIVVGTYLVIPLLNVLFIIFLEATQPEI